MTSSQPEQVEPTSNQPKQGVSSRKRDGAVRTPAKNAQAARSGARKGDAKRSKGIGPAPDGYQPPRSETPEAARPRQPSLPREELLPLVDVGSRKFEFICRAVAARAFEGLVVRSVLKRTTGVEQYGVDVEGFDRRQDPVVVISAKCYKDVCAWDFRPWIYDFLKHLDGHWAGKGVRHFVLAVAHECNDDPMNAAAKAMVLALEEKGIGFHLWDARLLSDLVARDPLLVDRYFGSHWVEAVSSSASLVSTAAPALPSAMNRAEIAKHLLALASQMTKGDGDQFDRLMTERLELAVEALRAGRPGRLEAWIAEARADDDKWSMLSASTRARALRLLSMLLLQRGDGLGAAIVLDDAETIHSAPDASARALVIRSTAGPLDALTLIALPITTQERELKAAFLMEAGRAPEALAYLVSLEGEEVTAEVLRLRAIARFETGDHESALVDATSAHRRAPLDASTSFTLATVKLLQAFVPGVRGRFGDKPNPINPALLLDTPGARFSLDGAIAGLVANARVGCISGLNDPGFTLS